MGRVIAETDRLLLRELTPEDAFHFYSLNEDPEVLKFTGDDPFVDLAEATRFLEQYKPYALYGMGRWAVIEKITNEWLGWCGLKFHPDGQWVDLGFRFYRRFWGMGYATESSMASLKYGFEKLNVKAIIGRARVENLASIRVLQKVGMRPEGAQVSEGKDWHRFSITRNDFKRAIVGG